MARSKKGRRSGGGRRPAASPTAARAGRREAARRADSEARRAADAENARSRRRRIAVIAVLTIVTGTGVWFFGTRPRPVTAEAAALARKAPAAVLSAGCTSIRTVAPYAGSADMDRAHIGSAVRLPPPLASYPTQPPTSGPHDPVPLDAGAYAKPPSIYRAIHSLEHGAVIVWYGPSALPADVAMLIRFFTRPDERDHVIVAPYDYPGQGTAGQLASDQSMVLVAWHRMQSCASVSLPVAVAFVNGYAAPTRSLSIVGKPRGYEGVAPEAGLAI